MNTLTLFGQSNKQDSLSFELCQMFGFDQGLRTSELWDVLPKETKIKADSIVFEKLVDFIRQHGYPNEALLGKDNYSQECVQSSPMAILLHNPKRIMAPDVYALLKSEVVKGNLSVEALAIYLDKYYVVYEKRSLFNSPFKAWTKADGVCIQDKEDSAGARLDIGLEALSDSAFVDCDKK